LFHLWFSDDFLPSILLQVKPSCVNPFMDSSIDSDHSWESHSTGSSGRGTQHSDKGSLCSAQRSGLTKRTVRFGFFFVWPAEFRCSALSTLVASVAFQRFSLAGRLDMLFTSISNHRVSQCDENRVKIQVPLGCLLYNQDRELDDDHFYPRPQTPVLGDSPGYNRGHSGIGPTLTGGLLGDFPHVGLVILPLGHVVITTAMGWTTMSEESVTVAAMLPTAPVWSHSTECANDLSMDNRTDGSNLQTLYSFG
jgi:hypothetical protein